MILPPQKIEERILFYPSYAKKKKKDYVVLSQANATLFFYI
jgi:hypothetical protein